jgi:hypothetical protein
MTRGIKCIEGDEKKFKHCNCCAPVWAEKTFQIDRAKLT